MCLLIYLRVVASLVSIQLNVRNVCVMSTHMY
jgi:hypothetical protein